MATDQGKDKKKDTRSAEQIRRDIAASRARVSAHVEHLVEEVNPTTVKDRAVDQAKAFAQSEFNAAKAQFTTSTGLRKDRLIAVGAAVAGVVLFIVTVRAIVGGKREVEPRRSGEIEG